jgi:hypothetical protein
MAAIFCDGFDNYNTQGDLWDFPNGNSSIQQNNGKARTGIGCLLVTAGLGPIKTFANVLQLLCCTNTSTDTAGYIMQFLDLTFGADGAFISLQSNPDGSLQVFARIASGQYGSIGTSAQNIFRFNTYNCVAMECNQQLLGFVNVWCNGVKVLALTNVRTQGTQGTGNSHVINACQLMSAGGLPNCLHDDVYMLDTTTAPNNTFLGALKFYAIAPTANASVAFTPLTGTNWSEVNEVPPDGDTSYVSSGNVGDQDQYVYPLTGVPANSVIAFLQHELDMKVDVGSRSAGSVLQGATVANPVALTSGYHIYATPYDSQPGGSAIWTPGTFPITAGPKVTA